MNFHTVNISSSSQAATPSSDTAHNLTLSAQYPTDIWRKPPSTNVFTAPIIYHKLPVGTFHRARVSVRGEWKTLYDQGGLVVVLPSGKKSLHGDGKSGGENQQKWIKAGIEFYGDRPRMSVVAAQEWADWSLSDLSPESNGRVTIEIERLKKEVGEEGYVWSSVLRVSVVGHDGVRTPVRETTWAFWDLDEEQEMWVGVYAAKPTGDGREELEVKFEGFEVERRVI